MRLWRLSRNWAESVASRTVTLTFAPAFLEVPDHPKWGINIGFAQKPHEFRTAAGGWLPLQLPDGSRIQQLRVVFGGTGRLSEMNVKLQRQCTLPASPETLANCVSGTYRLGGLHGEKCAVH